MDLANVSGLVREGFWAVALFLAATVGAYILLARSESARLGSAVIRSFVSFFSSPWGYLRKTVQDLALGNENPRLRDTDHYLLNRLISTAQVALVIGIVLGIGLTLTTAAYSSLPPYFLRQELANAKLDLAKAKSSASALEVKIKQQDDDWQNRRSELIQKAKDEEQQKITAARQVLARDEAPLQSMPATAQVLTTLKSFLEQHSGERYAAEQAKEFLRRLPSLNEPQLEGLIAYCDHWSELQAVSTVSPNSPESIRAKIQPDHDRMVGELEQTKAFAEMQEVQVASLQKQVNDSYRPALFFVTIGTGVLLLLLWTWAAGLAIELFSMGFYLSNDVKNIRSELEKPRARSAAAGGTL